MEPLRISDAVQRETKWSGAALIYRVVCQVIDPASIVRHRTRRSMPLRAAFGGGLTASIDRLRPMPRSAAVIDGSSCGMGCRRFRYLIADGSVEPNQEFAHHRYHDHLARLAPRT